MKNVLKSFGIIVFVAVIGFSMVACDDNSGGGSGGGGGGGGGGGSGGITIMNIPSEYNGKYVTVAGTNPENPYGLGVYANITGNRISNGRITIHLSNMGTINAYSGSDTLSIYIVLYNNSDQTGEVAERWWTAVAFSRGNATVSWDEGGSWY